MTGTEDSRLLREFADRQSDAAFSKLVQRHVNLVYSVVLRQTGNPHHAEEITQAVFLLLARKAGSLPAGTILSGWLYQAARLTAANFLRAERRRAFREQEAYMQSLGDAPGQENWLRIAPLLEEAMGKLGEKDRNAIVLRFFEDKSLRDVGLALGTSEDAAKMRVNRALEKLRRLFTKRGATLSVAAIAAALSANSVKAAPAELVATIVKSLAAGGSIGSLATGAIRSMTMAKVKTGASLGAAMLASLVAIHLAVKPGAAVSAAKPVNALQLPATNVAPAATPVTNSAYSLLTIEPTPGFDSLHAAALNNRGQVVGSLDSTNHETRAFLWENGLVTDLGTFGGTKSLASAINDAGDVVGTILTNGQRHAFLRHNGAVSDLGLIDDYAKLGLEGNTYYTPCITINNQAQVAGHLTVADESRSFVLNQGQPA
jgi:RNA polymerase sigma factor (sigma-70 family)